VANEIHVRYWKSEVRVFGILYEGEAIGKGYEIIG
jgi:hypothetical protein